MKEAREKEIPIKEALESIIAPPTAEAFDLEGKLIKGEFDTAGNLIQAEQKEAVGIYQNADLRLPQLELMHAQLNGEQNSPLASDVTFDEVKLKKIFHNGKTSEVKEELIALAQQYPSTARGRQAVKDVSSLSHHVAFGIGNVEFYEQWGDVGMQAAGITNFIPVTTAAKLLRYGGKAFEAARAVQMARVVLEATDTFARVAPKLVSATSTLVSGTAKAASVTGKGISFVLKPVTIPLRTAGDLIDPGGRVFRNNLDNAALNLRQVEKIAQGADDVNHVMAAQRLEDAKEAFQAYNLAKKHATVIGRVKTAVGDVLGESVLSLGKKEYREGVAVLRSAGDDYLKAVANNAPDLLEKRQAILKAAKVVEESAFSYDELWESAIRNKEELGTATRAAILSEEAAKDSRRLTELFEEVEKLNNEYSQLSDATDLGSLTSDIISGNKLNVEQKVARLSAEQQQRARTALADVQRILQRYDISGEDLVKSKIMVLQAAVGGDSNLAAKAEDVVDELARTGEGKNGVILPVTASKSAETAALAPQATPSLIPASAERTRPATLHANLEEELLGIGAKRVPLPGEEKPSAVIFRRTVNEAPAPSQIQELNDDVQRFGALSARLAREGTLPEKEFAELGHLNEKLQTRFAADENFDAFNSISQEAIPSQRELNNFKTLTRKNLEGTITSEEFTELTSLRNRFSLDKDFEDYAQLLVKPDINSNDLTRLEKQFAKKMEDQAKRLEELQKKVVAEVSEDFLVKDILSEETRKSLDEELAAFLADETPTPAEIDLVILKIEGQPLYADVALTKEDFTKALGPNLNKVHRELQQGDVLKVEGELYILIREEDKVKLQHIDFAAKKGDTKKIVPLVADNQELTKICPPATVGNAIAVNCPFESLENLIYLGAIKVTKKGEQVRNLKEPIPDILELVKKRIGEGKVRNLPERFAAASTPSVVGGKAKGTQDAVVDAAKINSEVVDQGRLKAASASLDNIKAAELEAKAHAELVSRTAQQNPSRMVQLDVAVGKETIPLEKITDKAFLDELRKIGIINDQTATLTVERFYSGVSKGLSYQKLQEIRQARLGAKADTEKLLIEQLNLFQTMKIEGANGKNYYMKIGFDDAVTSPTSTLGDLVRRHKAAENLERRLKVRMMDGSLYDLSEAVPETRQVKTTDGLTLQISEEVPAYRGLGKNQKDVQYNFKVLIDEQELSPEEAARLEDEMRFHLVFNVFSSSTDVELGAAKINGKWHITRIDDELFLTGFSLPDRAYHSPYSMGLETLTSNDLIRAGIDIQRYKNADGTFNRKLFQEDFALHLDFLNLHGKEEATQVRLYTTIEESLRGAGYSSKERTAILQELNVRSQNLEEKVQKIVEHGEVVLTPDGRILTRRESIPDRELRSILIQTRGGDVKAVDVTDKIIVELLERQVNLEDLLRSLKNADNSLLPDEEFERVLARARGLPEPVVEPPVSRELLLSEEFAGKSLEEVAAALPEGDTLLIDGKVHYLAHERGPVMAIPSLKKYTVLYAFDPATGYIEKKLLVLSDDEAALFIGKYLPLEAEKVESLESIVGRGAIHLEKKVTDPRNLRRELEQIAEAEGIGNLEKSAERGMAGSNKKVAGLEESASELEKRVAEKLPEAAASGTAPSIALSPGEQSRLVSLADRGTDKATIDWFQEQGFTGRIVPSEGESKSLKDYFILKGSTIEKLLLWQATKVEKADGSWVFIKVGIGGKLETGLSKVTSDWVYDEIRRHKFAENILAEEFGIPVPITRTFQTPDGFTIVESPILGPFAPLGKVDYKAKLETILSHGKIPADQAESLRRQLDFHAVFNVWGNAGDAELLYTRIGDKYYITRVDDEKFLASFKVGENRYGLAREYSSSDTSINDAISAVPFSPEQLEPRFGSHISRLEELTNSPQGVQRLQQYAANAGYTPNEADDLVFQLQKQTDDLRERLTLVGTNKGAVVLDVDGSYRTFFDAEGKEVGERGIKIDGLGAHTKDVNGDISIDSKIVNDLACNCGSRAAAGGAVVGLVCACPVPALRSAATANQNLQRLDDGRIRIEAGGKVYEGTFAGQLRGSIYVNTRTGLKKFSADLFDNSILVDLRRSLGEIVETPPVVSRHSLTDEFAAGMLEKKAKNDALEEIIKTFKEGDVLHIDGKLFAVSQERTGIFHSIGLGKKEYYLTSIDASGNLEKHLLVLTEEQRLTKSSSVSLESILTMSERKASRTDFKVANIKEPQAELQQIRQQYYTLLPSDEGRDLVERVIGVRRAQDLDDVRKEALRNSQLFLGEGGEGLVIKVPPEVQLQYALGEEAVIKIGKGFSYLDEQAALLNRLAKKGITPHVFSSAEDFYIAERIIGRPLKDIDLASLALPEKEALLHELRRLAKILEEEGIKIEDFSAQNFIVTEQNQVKLIDVGLARVLPESDKGKFYEQRIKEIEQHAKIKDQIGRPCPIAGGAIVGQAPCIGATKIPIEKVKVKNLRGGDTTYLLDDKEYVYTSGKGWFRSEEQGFGKSIKRFFGFTDERKPLQQLIFDEKTGGIDIQTVEDILLAETIRLQRTPDVFIDSGIEEIVQKLYLGNPDIILQRITPEVQSALNLRLFRSEAGTSYLMRTDEIVETMFNFCRDLSVKCGIAGSDAYRSVRLRKPTNIERSSDFDIIAPSEQDLARINYPEVRLREFNNEPRVQSIQGVTEDEFERVIGGGLLDGDFLTPRQAQWVYDLQLRYKQKPITVDVIGDSGFFRHGIENLPGETSRRFILQSDGSIIGPESYLTDAITGELKLTKPPREIRQVLRLIRFATEEEGVVVNPEVMQSLAQFVDELFIQGIKEVPHPQYGRVTRSQLILQLGPEQGESAFQEALFNRAVLGDLTENLAKIFENTRDPHRAGQLLQNIGLEQQLKKRGFDIEGLINLATEANAEGFILKSNDLELIINRKIQLGKTPYMINDAQDLVQNTLREDLPEDLVQKIWGAVFSKDYNDASIDGKMKLMEWSHRVVQELQTPLNQLDYSNAGYQVQQLLEELDLVDTSGNLDPRFSGRTLTEVFEEQQAIAN